MISHLLVHFHQPHAERVWFRLCGQCYALDTLAQGAQMLHASDQRHPFIEATKNYIKASWVMHR